MSWTQVEAGLEEATPAERLELSEKPNVEAMAPKQVKFRKEKKLSSSAHDPVNHPKHYTGHPSGIECIQVTEHMSFCLGNAVKYIWRADLKQNTVEDLQKAIWYINREIEKRSK